MHERERFKYFLLIAFLFLASLTLQAQMSRAGRASITGVVVDANGAVVPGATVKARRSASDSERSATSDAAGRYRFDDLTLGTYTVTAEAPGFEKGASVVNVAGEAVVTANLGLGAATLAETVTVTAQRGETSAAFRVPESLSVIGEREIAERRALVLPQLFEGEPGVAVQQTTASQGSPYVRGLTGQQVVNLIDGVRYNNATFRPGPNQYTALIEPADVGRIEIVRGPNSTQYGSDSFGGTVNILTMQPAPFNSGREWHGGLDTFFGSADLSTGASAYATSSTERTSFIFGGAARQAQDLRAGGGGDSRAAVTRFLGLDPKTTMGSRLQDTGFQQYAAHGKFLWTPTTKSLLTFNYAYAQQRGGRRYDQLNGGNGNLINDFTPQVLNFFYARYQRERLGFLDTLSATFSLNSQRDDRLFQGGLGNSRGTITDEYNRTDAYGYTIQGDTHIGSRQSLVFGAELYDEYVTSRREETNPVTGATKNVRARYPNGARYTSLGLFVQDTAEIMPNRLRAIGGLRYSRFNYRQSASANPFVVGGLPAVPDTDVSFDDVTFNLGAVLQANSWLSFNGLISRGFRAPNISDFGSIGLTSVGFEITPQAAIDAGADFQPLGPEKVYNLETGFKIKTGRFEGALKYFDSDIRGLIEREDLILPQGAVGRSVGGQIITRQNSNGASFTSLSGTRPVQVRQNSIEDVRLRGLEADVRGRLTSGLWLTANTAYIRNNVEGTDTPAELEGFAPPFISYAGLRYEPLGRSYWFEVYSTGAYRQSRYSEDDFGEQRSGAARSRNAISSFFRNGAVARGLVRADSAGVLRLVSTGETLAQLQNRLLPIGATINGVFISDDATDVPLFTRTAGFVTFNARFGYRVGERHTLIFGVENILDKNYRIHGAGVDAPGINATARYSFRF